MTTALQRLTRHQEPWITCPMPTGWTWTTCPVIPQRSVYDRYTFRAWDPAKHKPFDTRDYAPTGATAYYVDYATGNDGNTGADWANALKGVKVAVAKGDQDVIYVRAGTYPRGYGWEGTSTARAFSVIAVGGQVVLSNHYADLIWTADPVNVGAWQTTVPAAVWSVWDAANLDAYGNYSALTAEDSAAHVAANAGTWYLNGTDLWVHTTDSREPDSDVRCYANASGAVVLAGTTNYVEGITSEGSNVSGFYTETTGSVYCKNCKSAYVPTAADGFQVLNALAVFQNCEVAKIGNDGITYHKSTAAPTGIEIDCVLHDVGEDISDQCSTIHDGGTILCINNEYLRPQAGDAVKDIGIGTQRWALGCRAYSDIAAYSCWRNGDANGSASMWLDGCKTEGTAKTLASYGPNSFVYYHNVTGDVTAVDGGTGATIREYDGVNPTGTVYDTLDTYLADPSATVQKYNYGALDYLRIRVPGGNPGCQVLLQFDLSGIPAGSTCNSATLYLHHQATSTASAWTVNVYAIKAANGGWVEGTKSGAQAGAGEPCWDAKEADGAGGVTTAWAGSEGCSTSGTDYEAVAIGSFSGNRADAVGTEYSAALSAATVATWFGTPNSNYGMLLKVASGAVDYLYSSGYVLLAYRPHLVVDYTAP